VDWKFLPTTLLAQADSCIGSKSSVNLGTVKNILGTFNPPSEIAICGRFLDTLEQKDIRSGIGEIIKVHAIDSSAAFDRLMKDYDRLMIDRAVLIHYTEQALKIKKRYIEVDEFDQGVRNIFNYGHSFGHAIESATDFAVPHGIAVTMGMQIANSVATQRGLITESQHMRMQPLLKKNLGAFANTAIPFDATLSALVKDKKNTASQLVVILPVGAEAAIEKVPLDNDSAFRSQLQAALAGVRQ
jgi:3-dehydroquinate synthase